MAEVFAKAKTTNSLRGLSPLLVAWLETLEQFCAASGYTNNPWWYNERASISTLAGAAWKLHDKGWVALEEYSTRKRGVVPDKKIEAPKKTVAGRCDLYVSHRSSDFAFEAKQVWQPITKLDCEQKTPEAMSSARHAARNLNASEAFARVGLVFTIPYLQVRSVQAGAGQVDRGKVMSRVEEWLNSQLPGTFDAYAYYFPQRCDQFISKTNGRLFPGVLLTMSYCPKGHYVRRA